MLFMCASAADTLLYAMVTWWHQLGYVFVAVVCILCGVSVMACGYHSTSQLLW